MLRIIQGCDEDKQAVEEVNTHCVRDNVETTNEDESSKKVEEEKETESAPSGELPWDDSIFEHLDFDVELLAELGEFILLVQEGGGW